MSSNTEIYRDLRHGQCYDSVRHGGYASGELCRTKRIGNPSLLRIVKIQVRYENQHKLEYTPGQIANKVIARNGNGRHDGIRLAMLLSPPIPFGGKPSFRFWREYVLSPLPRRADAAGRLLYCDATLNFLLPRSSLNDSRCCFTKLNARNSTAI